MAIHHFYRIEKTKNLRKEKEKTMGALLIRNPWGTGWGEQGHGRLLYDYALWGLTEDFWRVVKKKWVINSAFAE